MSSEPGYEQTLPCPLCGSPPTIDHSGSTDFVRCSNSLCYLHKCEGTMLLSQWNKRVSVTLTEEEKKTVVELMVNAARDMGEISLRRNMGAALSALLAAPCFELRRRG